MRIPEWQGWVAIGLLVASFLAITWWLLLAPLSSSSRTARSAPRARHIAATLVLVSGAFFTVGARWDELWHRIYGGFGDDFFWPPHLLMYAGLGLNLVFALVGIATAIVPRTADGAVPTSNQRSIRERLRDEPAISLLGITAAFQLASIPSDLVWHQIIGPDLTAWSLPHVVLAATTTTVLFAGVALSRARRYELGWRTDALTIGILVTSQLALLQVGTTEWDWSTDADRAVGGVLASRPAWSYPLITVVVGVLHSAVARIVTGRVGAASMVAAICLLVQGATAVVGRIHAPPGPSAVTAMAVAYGAVAMDLWWRYRRRSGPGDGFASGITHLALPDLIAGTCAWVAGFSVLGLSGIGRQAGIASDDIGTWLLVFVAITTGAISAAIGGSFLGTWIIRFAIGVINRPIEPPAARPVPATVSSKSSRRDAPTHPSRSQSTRRK
jgi:hypothetical protein